MQPISTCKNCGHQFEGKYCNQCGEKLFDHHEKSIAHLAHEGFHFITHFEGKFFTTAKTILRHPGKLSADYCSGVRKKYFKPLSFFLLLVVIYLLLPFAQGLNMPLQNHLQSGTYGAYAKNEVVKRMASKKFSEPYLLEHFRTSSEKVSKILLLLVIPIMALWSNLLIRKMQYSFYDHFIFSTEINAFLLLWGFLLFPLFFMFLFKAVSFLIPITYFPDSFLGILLLLFVAVYTFLAAKRFYKLTVLCSLLFMVLFVGFYYAVVQYLYKFLLFYISLKLVH